MNGHQQGRPRGKERSNREQVIYIQDLIFLAVMSKRPADEINDLIARLKRATSK